MRTRTGRPGWTRFVSCFRFLRPKLVVDNETPDTDLGPTGVRSPALDPAWEKLSAFLNFRIR